MCRSQGWSPPAAPQGTQLPVPRHSHCLWLLLTLAACVEEVRRGILSSNLTSSSSAPAAREGGERPRMQGAVHTARLRQRRQALVLGPSPDAGPSLPLLLHRTHPW